MRGLAFPSDAAFDRETSYEYGTPITHPDDVPIDPALGGPVIDPALMGEPMDVISHDLPETKFHDLPFPIPPHFNHIQQYSDGPQGDPFAPQPPPMYFPIEIEQPISPPKPAKRKRKPPRERECGFCQKNEKKNQNGEVELLATCDECGRSGHPSCMHLPGLGPILQSYAWKCTECKTCEICNEKGNDDQMLFCDFCDRGWHMGCMQPPIEEAPNGKWHCPKCPPYLEEEGFDSGAIPLDEHNELPPDLRESSVASSSRSVRAKPQLRGRGKGKGKPKLPTPVDSDADVDIDGEVEVRTRTPRKRGRPKKVKQALRYTDDERPTPLSPRRNKRARVQHQSPVLHPPLPRVRLRLPTQKARCKEREEEEPQKGLFDDILTDEERDTTKTSILPVDKRLFEQSRINAEKLLAPPPPPQVCEGPEIPSTPGPSSRPLRSSALYSSAAPSATPVAPSASPAPSSATPVPFAKGDHTALRIRSLRFGQFDIKTWFDAPFPEEYATIPDGRLWICEFCLKYMKSRFACERHRLKCKARHPPGDEIYRDGDVSVFEVDGRKNKIYCQNLCLLSKMFLDHKSLFYDVEPFLFYVMTEIDDFGARFVGYFSKEKQSPKDYNVSCIMTLPVRQRQGWGNLLIDFSYLLSKKEQRSGSPEKPLSGLGALGYRNYWTLALMRYFETAPDHPRLEDISLATAMTVEDIVTTLTQQGMISAREPTPPPVKPLPGQSIKLHKGRKNGVARRHLQRSQTNDKESEAPKGPFVAPKHYEISQDRSKISEYLRAWEAKGYLRLKPEKLQWSPYILTRREKGEKPKNADGIAVNGGEKDRSTVPEVESPTKSGDVTNVDKSATPNDIPSPSPMNIFDDDLPVEEVPRPPLGKRKSRSKTPVTENLLDLSRRKGRKGEKQDVPRPMVTEEGRSTRSGRYPHLREEATPATKTPHVPGRRSGRPSKQRLGEPTKAPLTPMMTLRETRKRTRVDSSDVEPEAEVKESTGDTTEEETSLREPPNGKYTNEEPRPVDLSFEDQLVPPLFPPVLSVVQVEKHIGPAENDERDVKWEDLGTPLTSIISQQSLPSDDTVFVVGTANGKATPFIEIDDGDADADGEYEEDAEGDVDEEGAL